MIKIYGDIILDRWEYGKTDRLSPEATVPILLKDQTVENLGGAANVAANIHALNVKNSILYGSLGKDASSSTLVDLLETKSIKKHISHNSPQTTTKTRLIGNNNQHIARLDEEQHFFDQKLADQFFTDLKKDDVVVISDYNKGLINKNFIDKATTICEKVIVDPKQSASTYQNCWLIKPNLKEFEMWAGNFSVLAATDLIKKYNWSWLIVTLGKDGLFVFDNKGNHKHIKERVKEVADVSGAGDTVSSILSYGVYQGMDIFRAAEFACRAASKSVEKTGVSLIQYEDLVKGTVFTNGCFDILHQGHVELLNYAKSLGKKLIVGLNSDQSVKALKGDSRPINNQNIRKKNLIDLGIVDDVLVFDEETPMALINQITPDLIVKGGDYRMEEVVGKEISPICIFPRVEDFSTTKIIEEMS